MHTGEVKKRPFLASECESLPDGEKWRRELVKEITKKISAIQNASLGEHRVREINDEINKLNKTKQYWDERIIELGGGNNTRRKQFYDVEGKELPGAPGYKYYGAAKDLPGVRELFREKDEEAELRRRKRTRADMYKNITPDYYGYRDEDDGILVVKEAIREKELLQLAETEFSEKKKVLREDIERTGGVFGTVQLALLEDEGEEENAEDVKYLASLCDKNIRSAVNDSSVKAHVDVPSQDQIGAIVVDERKRLLLEKFNMLM